MTTKREALVEDVEVETHLRIRGQRNNLRCRDDYHKNLVIMTGVLAEEDDPEVSKMAT